MGPDEIICRYVFPHERERVFAEVHSEIVGGNYGGRVTTRKILKDVLWWLIVHGDTTDYAKICNVCQSTGKPS